jgi:hypothetical protein
MASASDSKTCGDAGIRVGELTPTQYDGFIRVISEFVNSKRRDENSKGSVRCVITGSGGTGKTFLANSVHQYFQFVFPGAKITIAEDERDGVVYLTNESCDAINIGVRHSALPVAKGKELPGVVYIHLAEKISKAPKAQ